MRRRQSQYLMIIQPIVKTTVFVVRYHFQVVKNGSVLFARSFKRNIPSIKSRILFFFKVCQGVVDRQPTVTMFRVPNFW